MRYPQTSAEIEENEINLEKALTLLANYGIKVDKTKMLSTCREQLTVFHRACVVFVLRERKLTTPKIGAIINRDHCTVLYLLNYGARAKLSTWYVDKYNEFVFNYSSRDKILVFQEQIDYHEQQAKHHLYRAAVVERELKAHIKKLD